MEKDNSVAEYINTMRKNIESVLSRSGKHMKINTEKITQDLRVHDSLPE